MSKTIVAGLSAFFITASWKVAVRGLRMRTTTTMKNKEQAAIPSCEGMTDQALSFVLVGTLARHPPALQSESIGSELSAVTIG